MTSNMRWIEDLRKSQKNYKLAPTCQVRITSITVDRPVLVIGESVIAAFPVDCPDHNVRIVAGILHATVENRTYSVEYVYEDGGLIGGFTNPIYGEHVTIPGIVKDGIVMQVFPVLKDEYSAKAFESIKGVAELLGGEIKSIVYRAYYSCLLV